MPASHRKTRFSYEHHKKWDNFVRKIAGGLTIHRGVKGEWGSPTGELFLDRMIPVRISCSREDINKIVGFTIEHYDQEAVMVYKVSDEVYWSIFKRSRVNLYDVEKYNG